MIFSIGVILILTGSSWGAPQNQTVLQTDLASDLENWMSLLPDDLKQVPLNLLAIPGTHDSFTKDITSESEVSPDGEDVLRKLEFLTVVKQVMANWSKTQAYNATQLLQAGIRFFDLRFCYDSDNDNLYFCHSMYSTAVSDVLNQLGTYLENHPKEVIILDCQHFYNFTIDIHGKVAQMLADTFGSKLIPYQSSMSSLTLEKLNEQGQQVLVVYRDSEGQKLENYLWPTGSYPTPWYDTTNTTYLISRLDEGLVERSNDIGYISQLVLTPSVDFILENILSNLREKCAVDFNDERIEWISQQVPGNNGVNVIIADFIDLEDNIFSKTVINLNLNLDTSTIGQTGIMQKVTNFFHEIKVHLFR